MLVHLEMRTARLQMKTKTESDTTLEAKTLAVSLVGLHGRCTVYLMYLVCKAKRGGNQQDQFVISNVFIVSLLLL